MRRIKYIKGITLIALVITIVVLIILAAVAINLSLGNNGIFNRAKSAKEQYQNAEAQEQTEVGKTTNRIDNYIDSSRDDKSMELLLKKMKPNTWEVGVEQDLGDGLYGIRLKGTFSAGKNEHTTDFKSSKLGSARPSFVDLGGWFTISNSDLNRLSYNGYYWGSTNYIVGTFVGYSGHVRYQLMDSDANRVHQYDVWATYTV